MSGLERFGGKGVLVLTLEAEAQALGKRKTLAGFTFLKGLRLEEAWASVQRNQPLCMAGQPVPIGLGERLLLCDNSFYVSAGLY